MSFGAPSYSEKLWFSRSDREYKGTMPAFYYSSQFDWAIEIEKNISIIQKETICFIKQGDKTFSPYLNTNLTDSENSWKTLFFTLWGIKVNSLEQLPTFKSILQKYPNILSVGLSKLEANGTIKPHVGDSNVYVRCHLPIIIPAGLPDCGIEVNSEKRAWDSDKLLLFCDAYRHSVFNYSSEDRIVLIFDVLLDEYSDRREEIQNTIQITLWAQRHKGLKKLPIAILRILYTLFN